MKSAFAFLVVSAVCLVSVEARACEEDPSAPAPDHARSDLHWGAAYAVVGTVNAGFLALDVALAEEGFPAWLGGIELALGISQSVFAAVLATGNVMVAGCSPPWQEHGWIASSLLVIGGGWLITHGILAMAQHRGRRAPPVTPSVAFGAEGGAVGIQGTF